MSDLASPLYCVSSVTDILYSGVFSLSNQPRLFECVEKVAGSGVHHVADKGLIGLKSIFSF